MKNRILIYIILLLIYLGFLSLKIYRIIGEEDAYFYWSLIIFLIANLFFWAHNFFKEYSFFGMLKKTNPNISAAISYILSIFILFL